MIKISLTPTLSYRRGCYSRHLGGRTRHRHLRSADTLLSLVRILSIIKTSMVLYKNWIEIH